MPSCCLQGGCSESGQRRSTRSPREADHAKKWSHHYPQREHTLHHERAKNQSKPSATTNPLNIQLFFNSLPFPGDNALSSNECPQTHRAVSLHSPCSTCPCSLSLSLSLSLATHCPPCPPNRLTIDKRKTQPGSDRNTPPTAAQGFENNLKIQSWRT